MNIYRPENPFEQADALDDAIEASRNTFQPLASGPVPERAPSPAGVASGEPGTPEWNISPSPFDWQVMIWGGSNPRTGFAQPKLEFQFFGKFYSRRQIEQRAADICEREHRLFWQVREPSDVRFMRVDLAKLSRGQRQGVE